jgi:hypothetical protein
MDNSFKAAGEISLRRREPDRVRANIDMAFMT